MIMKKLRPFVRPLLVISLLAILAIINFLSANFEKNPFEEKYADDDVYVSYEGIVPSCDYTAELVYGDLDMKFDGTRELADSMVFSSGIKTVSGYLFGNSELIFKDTMYYCQNTFNDTCSLIIKYPDYRRSDFKLLFEDCLLYTGAETDTVYKPSYKLVLADENEFENYKFEFTGKKRNYGNSDMNYLCLKMDTTMNLNDDVVPHDMFCLFRNIRGYCHIPVVFDEVFIQKFKPFLIDKEFYSGQKSVEEIQKALSKYGLALEPTGEEMMVINVHFDYATIKESLPIRYEGKIPEYSYQAKFKYGKVDANKNEILFSEYSQVKNPVTNESRRSILAFMIDRQMDCNDDIMYNINMLDERCSFVVEFEKSTTTNDSLYKTMMHDMVKNAGINADTTYNASYKLIISDNERFDSLSYECVYNTSSWKRTFLENSEGFYSSLTHIYDNDDANEIIKRIIELGGLPVSMSTFLRNLQTACGIPVSLEYDSKYNYMIINLDSDFYSEPKSVEELQVMLSEYGMSLEPTGEEKMVVTFTTDELILDDLMGKNYDLKVKIFLLLIWGIFTCIMAAVPIRKEAVVPFRFNVMKTIVSLFLWALAGFFLIVTLLFLFDIEYVAMVTERLYDDDFYIAVEYAGLLSAFLVYVTTALGIMLFTSRKNFYSPVVKSYRILYGFSACVLHLTVFFMIAFGTAFWSIFAMVLSYIVMLVFSLVLHEDKLVKQDV